MAPDVDGWIAQAKKLQADIERSKATARNIVQQAETGKRLRSDATEAANKAGLLEKEVTFNETLVDILGQIRKTKITLEDCQNALVKGDLPRALATIRQVDNFIPTLAAVENTRAFDIIRKRNEGLKAALAEQAAQNARILVSVKIGNHSIAISPDSLQEIEVAIDTLSYLDSQANYISRLRHDIDAAIIQPRLSLISCRSTTIKVEGSSISATAREDEADITSILSDTWSILNFINTHLPVGLSSRLSERLLPDLLETLITGWLNQCVPVNIEDMTFFQQVLDQVSELAEQIDGLQWPANAAVLKEWIQSAPRTWLAKRRETALGEVRKLLFTKLRERRTVERVETQMVSKGDALMGGDQEQVDEAWDAEWGEEEPASPVTTKDTNKGQPANEDEDASAWDMEDDATEEPSATKDAEPDDEDADAWGWGDGEEDQAIQHNTAIASPKRSAQAAAARTPANAPAEREMTLKETYTVTAVPDGILEIIMQCVVDAETLADSSYAQTLIGPAASALYTLPTFALAMYRATASTAYSRLDAGNMLIYNDSTRLADQLRAFIARQTEKDASSQLAVNLRPSSRLKLDNEIHALDSFAKRAYSTEMDSQRTILGDMLDGAQGFANCITEPFASACESAVDITAGRLRDVHKQWEPILSRSALLQSLGSLLASVTSKMIVDIEDLSDIGEDESKKLREFCDRLSEVKELFVQEHPDGGQAGDMTGIYCPNWFKFQYLAEILESSLADIRYLWIEGELRLEFDADEVVDLIQALFSDSDLRRKAIADIKRSAR